MSIHQFIKTAGAYLTEEQPAEGSYIDEHLKRERWKDMAADKARNAAVQVSTDGGKTFNTLRGVKAGNSFSTDDEAIPDDGTRVCVKCYCTVMTPDGKLHPCYCVTDAIVNGEEVKVPVTLSYDGIVQGLGYDPKEAISITYRDALGKSGVISPGESIRLQWGTIIKAYPTGNA